MTAVMQRTVLALCVPVAMGLSVGCSLALEDIDLPKCESDAECDKLSQFKGFPEGCRRFFCNQQGRCVEHDGEVCDGHDNDCDQLIDEPRDDGTQTIQQPGEGTRLVQTLDGAAEVSVGVGADGTPAAAWTLSRNSGRPRRAKYTILRGSAGGSEEMGYRTNQEEDLRQGGVQLQSGCRRYVADGEMIATTDGCGFAEAAVDLTPSTTWVAAIDPQGCRAGRLRLGFFENGAPPGVIVRGPVRRSNSYLGVDMTSNGQCSGHVREACRTAIANGNDSEIQANCGLSRVSIAAMPKQDGRLSQALVGWIGKAFELDAGSTTRRGECGGSEANIEIIGAYRQEDQFGEEFQWVTASGETTAPGLFGETRAEPEVLGRTAGSGRPAIEAWESEGYFVGYGDASGQLALHFVPRPGDPPPVCIPGQDDSCPVSMCGGTPCERYRGDVRTDPLEGIEDFERLSSQSGGSVDNVTIAAGARRDDGTLELGVVWREGCGTGSERIVFRKVRLDVSGSSPRFVEATEPVRLSADGTRVGPPTIAYRPEGFFVPGVTPGDGGMEPIATEATDGGWLVAWPQAPSAGESSLLVGKRVSERDGQVLAENEVVGLTRRGLAGMGESVDAARARLYRDGNDRLRVAYHDRGLDSIVGGPALCNP